MTAYGVDYAFTHPNLPVLREHGVQWVGRYCSDFPDKNLSRAEALQLARAGLWIVSVWEDNIDDVARGRDGGRTAASRHIAQSKAAGCPDGRPRYYAVDEDIAAADAIAYFVGINDVHRSAASVGAYGSGAVLEGLAAAGLITYQWHAMPTGWRAGPLPLHAHIVQGGSATYGNVIVDADTAMSPDFGQWQPGRVPSAPPGYPRFVHELRYVEPQRVDEVATTWQQHMRARGWSIIVDGLYGPHSRDVCQKFQAEKSPAAGPVDGIVGPLTWRASWTLPLTP